MGKFNWKKKLKFILSRINNSINEMSNRRWMTISFIILFIFMMIVSVPMFYEPWIMVEDGTIFLNEYFSMGARSFLVFYGGYLNFLSRLSAMLAIYFGKATNSIIVTVMIIKWITIFYEIFIINYFNDNCYSWLVKSRVLRLFYSIIFMYMMGNFFYLFYNTTSVHWFCGLLCFIVGINLIKEKMPRGYIIPFLLLGILSSPSSLALGFALLYYFVKKINKNNFIVGTFKNIGLVNFIKMFLIAYCLLIQIIIILGGSGSNGGGDISLIKTIYHTILFMLQTPIYFMGVGIASKFSNIYLSIIFGSLALLFFGVVFYKSKKINLFIYGVLTIFCLYFMTLFKNSSTEYYDYLFNSRDWYYHAIPGCIMLFFGLLVMDYLFKIKKLKGLLYLVIFIFVCKNLYTYSFEYTDLLWKFEEKVDFKSDTYIKVPIFPDKDIWYLNVPVKIDD